MAKVICYYKSPLGKVSTDARTLAHWNRLADAIATKAWVHYGTDDRYGVISFRSTDEKAFLPPHSGGVEMLHVEHALALYERIYGRPFTEEP